MKRMRMATGVMGGLLAISLTTASAEEKVFALDPVHSSVTFRIRHLYTDFVGRFNGATGTLRADPEHRKTLKTEWASLSVTAEVALAGIDTANTNRDAHLLSPDFFDAVQFPKAKFASMSARSDDGTNGTVFGELTLHGVTKEIAFKGRFTGYGDDPWGGKRIGFHATTTIVRQDFGISYDGKLPNGLLVLGSDVELTVDVEAIEQLPAPAAVEKKEPPKEAPPAAQK